jgi:hypothetical protein
MRPVITTSRQAESGDREQAQGVTPANASTDPSDAYQRPPTRTSDALIALAAQAPRAARDVTVRAARVGRDVVVAVEQIPSIVRRANSLLGSIESLVARISAVTEHAESVVTVAQQAADGAGDMVGQVSDLQQRASGLFGVPQPLRDAFAANDDADTEEPAKIPRRSGPLVEQLGSLVMPFLAEMRAAMPDATSRNPRAIEMDPAEVDASESERAESERAESERAESERAEPEATEQL